jgi:ABC-type cobalamin/Fe3+-siderophores transport system ATPase subunit
MMEAPLSKNIMQKELLQQHNIALALAKDAQVLLLDEPI